jgi:hypothetical protein
VEKMPVEFAESVGEPVETNVGVEKRPDLFPSLFENVAFAEGIA